MKQSSAVSLNASSSCANWIISHLADVTWSSKVYCLNAIIVIWSKLQIYEVYLYDIKLLYMLAAELQDNIYKACTYLYWSLVIEY